MLFLVKSFWNDLQRMLADTSEPLHGLTNRKAVRKSASLITVFLIHANSRLIPRLNLNTSEILTCIFVRRCRDV